MDCHTHLQTKVFLIVTCRSRDCRTLIYRQRAFSQLPVDLGVVALICRPMAISYSSVNQVSFHTHLQARGCRLGTVTLKCRLGLTPHPYVVQMPSRTHLQARSCLTLIHRLGAVSHSFAEKGPSHTHLLSRVVSHLCEGQRLFRIQLLTHSSVGHELSHSFLGKLPFHAHMQAKDCLTLECMLKGHLTYSLGLSHTHLQVSGYLTLILRLGSSHIHLQTRGNLILICTLGVVPHSLVAQMTSSLICRPGADSQSLVGEGLSHMGCVTHLQVNGYFTKQQVRGRLTFICRLGAVSDTYADQRSP